MVILRSSILTSEAAMFIRPRFILLMARVASCKTSGSSASAAPTEKRPLITVTMVPALAPCPAASPIAVVRAPAEGKKS
jgi:hypothetical protein